MQCPFCESDCTKVVDTRPKYMERYRRYHCMDCDRRFSTIEVVQTIGDNDRWKTHRKPSVGKVMKHTKEVDEIAENMAELPLGEDVADFVIEKAESVAENEESVIEESKSVIQEPKPMTREEFEAKMKEARMAKMKSMSS